ncbi:U11/U12 small nuclear ribonucleoprotein 35 kDa protein-like [Daphnia pulicaria]|uniref:U11/U12 small nuclear ribonucleoprotein 35 kDa protein-like n=1 Tax=Daphnia pulicaria TaxID=35523 RepID=UPI001EEC29AE|nr:U11/U12 small nuclear ribonucleoprotein 35 kDa protein-like [Daphnia pulicaria]
MANCYKKWSPYAGHYNPIEVGSKDGKDIEPHDNAIVRACNALYHPNHLLTNNPQTTLFIGRLDKNVTEKDLEDVFIKYGKLKNVTVVRDVVTGYSKRYGFVEFKNKHDCHEARSELHQTVLKGKKILVEFECQQTLPGWIPRRLGGGFGGKKESGQLRFGCLDRPWKRPVQVELNCSKTPTCDTHKHANKYRTESERLPRNLHETKDGRRDKSRSYLNRNQAKRYGSEDSSENPKRRKT